MWTVIGTERIVVSPALDQSSNVVYNSRGSSNDFQHALRLLSRRVFTTMDATALNARMLEQFFAGVRYPQIRNALLLDRSSALDKTLALACEDEVFQAACMQPPRLLFGVTAIQTHTTHDV
ncbi:unnamed protein product [Schistocephalus solidus]|uniref:Transposase n=1 Tax=Schistocephalus solidus TaxID=70667 RepID=A0A183TJ62_SCHSO|nr:unnamed protein product [Schistocephalus solidus]